MRAGADRAGGNPDSKANDTYRDGERDRVIHDGLQRPVPVGSMPVHPQVSASTRGPATRPDHPALEGSNARACNLPSADTAALRTASREEKPVRGTIEPLVGALRPVQVADQFAGKTVNIDPF